jgi:hypothetical protein
MRTKVIRDGRKVKAELVLLGLSLPKVAELAGVHHSLAYRTAHGMLNNRRVLRALLAVGVSKKALAPLPEDVEKEAAA